MGLYEEERSAHLEHFGVKGMKWGQRNNKRIQKRLDRTKRVRDGSASTKDKVATAYIQGVYTKKGAARVLDRGARQQAKILDGKKKASDLMLRFGGINVRDLNYD